MVLLIFLSVVKNNDKKRFSLSQLKNQFNIESAYVSNKAHLTVCYSRMIQRKQNTIGERSC